MRVGAADAEGAHPGARRGRGPRPGGAFAGDDEGALVEGEARVGGAEVGGRWDEAVLQGERGLDQAGHAGGGVEVADVGLHRAQVDGAGGRVGTERLGERLHLDGVAERGGGAVRLDVLDGAGFDTRDGQRLGDDLGLAVRGRRGEADLGGAVVVDGRAADDGVDVVAVGDRVLQALEDDQGDAVAGDRAGGVRVERAAVAVRREDRALLVAVAARLELADRDAAREGHVGLAAEQRLHGQVHAHQGGGAGALHGEAGAGQAELVGDAQREHAGVVADRDLDLVGDPAVGAGVGDPLAQVAAARGAAKTPVRPSKEPAG